MNRKEQIPIKIFCSCLICFISSDASKYESLESKLYAEDEIPWDELAFPVVIEMLREFFEDRKTQDFPIRNSTIRYQHRRSG